MKKDQKLTPKYWVCHHKQTDDVLIHTACKGYKDVVACMELDYGEDWFMDDDFEIILVEIKQVVI